MALFNAVAAIGSEGTAPCEARSSVVRPTEAQPPLQIYIAGSTKIRSILKQQTDAIES